ncbi:unnamed protein product, partial [Candidula unifasciata]
MKLQIVPSMAIQLTQATFSPNINLADTSPSPKKSEPELVSVVDVEPELNHVGGPSAGSVLSAHNINYTVKVPTKCCGPKVDKQILYDVTGIFKEGLSAIMGPTGCGKST